MATNFEVGPSPDSPGSAANPYRATVVGHEGRFQTGLIRIEPPVTLYEGYLEILQGDVEVELSPRLQSQEATIVDFTVLPSGFDKMTDEARVEATVQSILNDLGLAATKQAFLQTYERTKE